MKKLKKIARFIGLIVSIYISLAFFTPFNRTMQNRANANQINYLLSQDNIDLELQSRYPEGYIFFNAILALSIIEHSGRSEGTNSYTLDVDILLLKLLSDQAANRFPKNQKLVHGAFYNGWVNYTLKKYLESDLVRYSDLHEHFKSSHDSLSYTIAKAQDEEITVLESYPGSHWPGDNMISIASLSSDYDDLASNWIDHLKAKSESDLIYHDDVDLAKVRGSSQSLIIYLLSEVNLDLAKSESSKFEKKFKSNFLGIHLIREDLQRGSFEDVDSGPVFFGFGSVATIMNAKGEKAIGQRSKITEGFLNVLGLPINIFGKKFYIFKQEVMFDLFMLWVQV